MDQKIKHLWEDHYPEGRDWHLSIDDRPLYNLIDNAVEKFGHHPAMDFLGKTYSYAQIGQMVDRAASALQQKLQVKKGSKVGLFLPNTPYCLIFFYAILKTGATVVNFNPLYAEKELIHQIEDSETDIMVTLDLKILQEKTEPLLSKTRLKTIITCPMADILPFPKNALFSLFKSGDVAKVPNDEHHISFSDIIDNNGDLSPTTINTDKDVAVLQYTGGTTGVPKGAMLTHKNLYANTVQISHWLGDVTPGVDAQVGVLPFFHVFAMTVIMNMSVNTGMKIIAVPKFDIDDVLKLIDKKKPTYLPAVPAIFSALANHPKISKYNFSSLKFCLAGGAPLPSDVKRLFEEKTGAKCVAEGYGLTESSPVATCNPVNGLVKTGSIGMPLPGTLIEIIDPEDRKTQMPTGEKGEVCITGPQVMKGYYNKPEATEDTLVNGRLYTGDIGYIDEDGYIFLVDRIKDLILVRGYNVYPRHVEEAIYEHPAVEECIVAGVPDKARGETVWAWIKLAEGQKLTADELDKFLDDKLSPIEQPRKIFIRTEPLPKTDVGKLSRKTLLEEEGITK